MNGREDDDGWRVEDGWMIEEEGWMVEDGWRLWSLSVLSLLTEFALSLVLFVLSTILEVDGFEGIFNAGDVGLKVFFSPSKAKKLNELSDEYEEEEAAKEVVKD